MTDRVIVYAGSIPLETDVLRSNKFAMIGIAKLAAAMLGTSTIVNGLACVPTGPASLTVNVNPGEIYSLVSMDATAYSSVAADTTHQIMKSGILLDAVNLSCPAPGTAGQSINYLVQVIYQDSDTDLTALPYYNASNPTQAWSGPNNSGTPQATTRKGIITMSAKAGAAAATGSQTTPTPDAGYTGLWVVTVANGQTQILAGNIAQYAGAPILPSSLLASIQNGNLSYAVATGTANAHVVALTPALQQRVDGMVIRYKAPAANTGALTLNDGLGAIAVVGAAHAALQGGETVTNGDVWVQWNSSIGGGSYIMVDSSGGALQIAPATQSAHALQAGQALGLFLGAQTFASSGTYTPGVYTVGGRSVTATRAKFRLVGGGGGGGGVNAPNSAQAAAACGGNGGEYKEYIVTSGLTSQTITIGGAGAGGAAGFNVGSQGGTTSVGALVSAVGGLGGAAGGAGAPPYVNTGQANNGGGSTSGPLVVWRGCELGAPGLAAALAFVLGGQGGNSPFGAGGKGGGSPSAGAYGAGGGGAAQGASGAAVGGSAGIGGYVLVEEYA